MYMKIHTHRESVSLSLILTLTLTLTVTVSLAHSLCVSSLQQASAWPLAAFSSSTAAAMKLPPIPVFLLLTLLTFSTFASAKNNITKLLDGLGDYSSFSSLLSKYGVANQINSRNTITVLCPSNAALDPVIASLGNNPSRQTIIDILSYHVLLDYYDLQKIKQIHNHTAVVTTLFQSTGLAAKNDGSVNITDVAGNAKLGLPAKNSDLTATVGKQIAAVPYNISLLTIDSVLIPIGANVPTASPTPTPSPAPSSAPAPAPASGPAPALTPTASPSKSPSPSSLSSSITSPSGTSANLATPLSVHEPVVLLLAFLVSAIWI
eukprot:c53259_g1_i1 orf=98-1057(+)